jgi:hypothetical protein
MSRIILMFLICLLMTPLFAQQDLNLTVQQPNPATAEWELSVAMTLGAETATGFYLQLPQGVRFIPTQIEANGNPLWLLNAEEIPQQDSVVCWYEKDNGLMIVFSENESAENSRIIINGMLMLAKNQLLPQEQFQIKTIAATRGSLAPTDQIVAAAGLPSPITK